MNGQGKRRDLTNEPCPFCEKGEIFEVQNWQKNLNVEKRKQRQGHRNIPVLKWVIWGVSVGELDCKF